MVVANSRHDGNMGELSVIYKWRVKKQRFVEYQKIQTHSARDWEAFRIHDDNFLAVANHREGGFIFLEPPKHTHSKYARCGY